MDRERNPGDRLMKLLSKAFVALSALTTLTSAAALPSLPSSGTCAMLHRDEIPFGIDVGTRGGAGFGFSSVTTITFTSRTAGTLSQLGTNVNYRTTDEPVIRNWGMLRNVTFTVTAMIDGTTGITGGYILETAASTAQFFDHATGALTGTTEAMDAQKWHVFPVNNGRTLLIQNGSYPTAGVCQF
jgi:hypothetical protein